MTTCKKKRNERHALQSLEASTMRAGWLIPLAILAALLSSANAALFGSSTTKQSVTTHPTLDLIEATMFTTAPQDFSRDDQAFVAASNWESQRLRDANQPGPYLACGLYGRGGEARSKLDSAFSPVSVMIVSHTETHGVCFVVTASPMDAEALLSDPSTFGLSSAVPFLSTMKLAPGLLSNLEVEVLDDGNDLPVLQNRHGQNIKLDGVRGLTVGLSPGITLSSDDTRTLTDGWRADLMSESLDLWSTSIWSDPDMLDRENGHSTHPGGRVLAREWSRAAEVVHGLAALHGTSVGEVCAWNSLNMRLMGDSDIMVTGINHLLYTAEASETRVACFMGLLSFLASKCEVLTVSPLNGARLQNAVASPILQSATVTKTPLHDAGLDGSGEVIQVVDSGLDETSCFFIDEDGETMEHGHYFDTSGIVDRYFPVDLRRRKIVQYIALQDGIELPSSLSSTFDEELYGGHGTHTAGSAAGATVDPDNAESSNDGIAIGAKLAIFDVSSDGEYFFPSIAGNDLWLAAEATGTRVHSNSYGADTLCVIGPSEILYDTFMYTYDEQLLVFAAGNEGGLKDDPSRTSCTIGSPALAKNVLTVGATSTGRSRSPFTGRDGKARYEEFGLTGYESDGSPYIGDNPSLGLPSDSSSPAGIDTIAFFSSYGPTIDQRIKPEVVAPGDQVLSALGGGVDDDTCQAFKLSGTSMACPLVAGGAALVRQYFTDDSFYTQDLTARGLCLGNPVGSGCVAFTPSSATVKAMLINSAHLMGGSAEPNNLRGFGRVYLEAGMPLGGSGSTVLFVADSSITALAQFTQTSYTFNVDGNAGLELRATLSWIDPPASTLSTQQLVHDLDLEVTSPDGTVYTMWESGIADTVNVNERVIVPASIVSDGVWTVTVSAKALVSVFQSCSLVVTGAISWSS